MNHPPWPFFKPTKTEGDALTRMKRHTLAAALAPALLLIFMASPRAAGHVTADQVRAMVAKMPPGKADLSGMDMGGDDLTGLDLSGAKLVRANLSGANLHGVKLEGADLTEANLAKADLTFTWIINTNFTRANLHGATMQTIVTSRGMENTPEQAAIFTGADLSEVSATVHFSNDAMAGVNFSHAHMSVVTANQS